MSRIPDRKTKHSIEVVKDLVAPLFVPMDNDLSIALGSKCVSKGFKFASKFQKIVDLAIENYPDGFLLVRHRLMTAFKVDDG